MLKRLTILCLSTIILVGIFGCEATTRYRALCFLFDGVPTPPGMVPCDNARVGALPVAKSNGKGTEAVLAYKQHGPYAARLCEGCHQRQTNKLLMAKEELCFNCHDLQIKKRIIHGPVASGSCMVCHDPHGSGNQYMLVAKSQDFCLHCHENRDILRTAAHQNMDNGCTSCHNAHASDNDFLLIASAAAGYKAKHQTPPSEAGQPLKERAGQPLKERASQPLKERASQPLKERASQPLKERASQPLKERASGGIKQELPTTSSELLPEKNSNKFPTSSGMPPISPGADLKIKRISKREPATQSAGLQVDLVEANRGR
jgi:predicted CXXCH cytochrome family protein